MLKKKRIPLKQIDSGCKECELSPTLDSLKKNLRRTKKLRIALVGQPNSGKSTFFNSLSSYKVSTANYQGTTVEYHTTTIFIKNYEIELIDLPGIFSLNYSDLAEKVTFEVLTNFNIDGIIQVVETASLPHSLILTLDLLTLNVPMVIALNMFDEARLKGISVDIDSLQFILNVPVIPTISIKGENTLRAVLKLIEVIEKSHNLESEFRKDSENFFENFLKTSPRSSFTREELPGVIKAYKELWAKLISDISSYCHLEGCKLIPACLMNIEKLAPSMKSLASVRDEILNLKSNIIMSISSLVFSYSKPRPTFEDIVDKFVLDRKWGYIILLLILLIAFYLSYFVGSFLADFIDSRFDGISSMIDEFSLKIGVLGPLIKGLKDGILGGLAIVFPYLIPFIFFIVLLEDSGYIPRMMYLMDNFLKAFGISGRSVLSFVLGLGCNVSAIMSLRGLTKYNERILAGMVIPFVPCSARTVVIMALVTGLLGALWGMFMYALSFTIILSVLFVINKLSNFNVPHIMVHVPPYRIPSLKSTLVKIWVKVKSFIFTAWPILILGTIVVNYLSFLGADKLINSLFSFLTVGVLNLPENTAMPLIFGVLAKEYALVMLYSALGTDNIRLVMSNVQIIVFSVFVLLYTPCISTIATQVREIGWKYTLVSIGLSVITAIVVSSTIGKLLSFIGF